SIFTNSFNVRCAGRLIHIGIIENGLAPFGIGLPRAEAVYMARRLGIGDQLVWHEATNTLIFTRGVSILLNDAERKTHDVQACTYDIKVLKTNYEYAANKLMDMKRCTGLVQTD